MAGEKKKSPEEMKELEEKLDRDIEEFMKNAKRRDPTDNVPIEELEEELKNHPFFIKEFPEDGSVPPLLEGLQQLKYSATENTPQELAIALKDDGNVSFKKKNYKLAIMCYTEALSKNCNDDEVNANLYNNRAAAHFELQNFRSCYNDCKRALALKPSYQKAKSRLANVCFTLKMFEECLRLCEELLPNQYFKDLKNKCLAKMNELARDERKKAAKERKDDAEVKAILAALEERKINMINTTDGDLSRNLFSEVVGKQVHLEDGKLVWPVILLYPEYQISDIIEAFHEDSTFTEQLSEVFTESPEWDAEKKYKPGNIAIYYEDFDRRAHKVNPSNTLKSVLSKKSFVVDSYTPSFIIVVKGSDSEYKFLNVE